jgi:hypothetical protein
MERLLGALGGIVIGVTICAFIRLALGLGLAILPISQMTLQILPGLVLGLILGLVFPRFFKWGLFLFLMIPGGGAS